MQEDVFLPNLTAWESLGFYARLSLPRDVSAKERRVRMESILETMGIAKVRHSMVRVLTSPLLEGLLEESMINVTCCCEGHVKRHLNSADWSRWEVICLVASWCEACQGVKGGD